MQSCSGAHMSRAVCSDPPSLHTMLHHTHCRAIAEFKELNKVNKRTGP